MTATRENAVKYSEIIGENMADKVGTVRISDSEFQLCDHIQKQGDDYYATAFYSGIKAEGKDIDGVYYKKLGDTPIALVPLKNLKVARPVYKDNGQTEAMLARLIKTLESLNAPVFSKTLPKKTTKAA